jgi:DnaJ-class molecular chaperone
MQEPSAREIIGADLCEECDGTGEASDGWYCRECRGAGMVDVYAPDDDDAGDDAAA